MTRIIPLLLLAACAVSTESVACPAPPVGTYMAVHTVEETGCGLLGEYETQVVLPDGWWEGYETDGSCFRERTLDAEACEVVIITSCGILEQRQGLSLEAAPDWLAGTESFAGDGCRDEGRVVMERLE